MLVIAREKNRRMQQRVDPGTPSQLVPACEVPGRGAAAPPRRIVELIRGFGASGTVQSICQPTFDGALLGIIDRLGRAIRRVECRE